MPYSQLEDTIVEIVRSNRGMKLTCLCAQLFERVSPDYPDLLGDCKVVEGLIEQGRLVGIYYVINGAEPQERLFLLPADSEVVEVSNE